MNNKNIKIIIDEQEVLNINGYDVICNVSEEETIDIVNTLRSAIKAYEMRMDDNFIFDYMNHGFDIDEFIENGNEVESVKWKVIWYDCQCEKTFETVDYMSFNDAIEYKGTILYSWFYNAYIKFNNITIEEYPEHTIAFDNDNNHIIVWMEPEKKRK